MSGRERRSLASNMYEQLTDDNFLLYCAKRYDNSEQITTDEFIEELDRIKYIKKLVTRFNETGELRERLILNHIITLANCFGQYTAKILFLKTEKQYSFVKPFLVMINRLPETIHNVGEHKVIHTDSITMSVDIIKALREINNGKQST